jgi:membrane protease subunit HflC
MKKAKRISGILLFIIIFAGVVILLSSLVVTREDQFSVIKRFGKIERIVDTAGLSFKTPFIEEVYVIPKNIQFYDMQPSDVITKDKKTMVADSYVLWKVVDPKVFAQTLSSSVISAEGRIDTTVYNAMKNVIGSLSQADVISGRDGTLNKAFMEKIGSSMDQYGIELITVETKHLDLPSDNKTAVFERMISERAQIAATYTVREKQKRRKYATLLIKK